MRDVFSPILLLEVFKGTILNCSRVPSSAPVILPGPCFHPLPRSSCRDLNETDLIFELVKDICNDLDVRRLCHKILQNVGMLTLADR